MWTLNAWQTFIWIIGLILLALPPIVWSVSSIINYYFQAKEKHISKLAKAAGEALTKIAENNRKKNEAKNAEREQAVKDLFKEIGKLDLSKWTETLNNVVKSKEKTEETQKEE